MGLTTLVNVSVMLKTSDLNKNIDTNKYINFLENLNFSIHINFYFFEKSHYDIPASKKVNVINLIDKTENLLNLFEYIKKSQLVITVDTSLYHIASYFNVPTTVLVNSKLVKINRIIKFWLDNYDENLIIKNRFFLKK